MRCMVSRATWLLLASTTTLAACPDKPAEPAIRATIDLAVARAEACDPAELLSLATDDFELRPGATDRLLVRRLVTFGLEQTCGSRAVRPRATISVAADGASAEASFPFLLVRGEVPGGRAVVERDAAEWLASLADKAHLFRIELELQRDGGDWLFRAASLYRFDGTGFRAIRFDGW